MKAKFSEGSRSFTAIGKHNDSLQQVHREPVVNMDGFGENRVSGRYGKMKGKSQVISSYTRKPGKINRSKVSTPIKK